MWKMFALAIVSVLLVGIVSAQQCDEMKQKGCTNFCGTSLTAKCKFENVQEGNTMRMSYLCQCVDANGVVQNQQSSMSSMSTNTGGSTSQSNCMEQDMQQCTMFCQNNQPSKPMCFSTNSTNGGTTTTTYNCQCAGDNGNTVAQTSSSRTSSSGKRRRRSFVRGL